MNETEIERLVRKIQTEIWRNREKIWPRGLPDLREMFLPEVVAKHLGVALQFVPDLGSNFGFRGQRFEVAGLIDRQQERIVVSTKFSSEIQQFTAAHELGHWVMHDDEVMHRDMPIRGLSYQSQGQDRKEREANHFAACLLMPRGSVKSALELNFGLETPIILNDVMAFALDPHDPDSLLEHGRDSMEAALRIASAESFQGRHFNSLAKQFKVSTTTMAIRLREIGLVRGN